MKPTWRAIALIAAVATACGGRSALEPSEADSSTPEPGASDPGKPDPGKPDPRPSEPEPDEPEPDEPEPDEPEPGEPEPGEPEPGGSDPGTPEPTVPQPTPVPTPDVNCTSDHAKGGMACSMPCVTTCGFYDLGTKGCDCVSGVFVSCHCPRPWDYQGATTAPTCNTTDGRTHWIDNTPCANEWAQCIGTDPVSGTNPRGCVCLTDPVNGKLEWTCGSTNKWFLHE